MKYRVFASQFRQWIAAIFAVTLLSLITASPALAREFRVGSKDDALEEEHLMSIGSGISAPALTSSTFGNPSGLVYNNTTKLVGSLATGFGNESILGNSFRLVTGNAFVGGALGIETYNNTADEGGSLTYVNFGLGTYVEAINLAFGISGNYRLAARGTVPGPYAEKTWAGNIGLLYNPFGAFRAGLTLFGANRDLEAMGAGVALSLNKYSVISFDAATTKQGNGLVVKPALGINASPFQLTYGYGVQIDKDNYNPAITAGNTIGLGFVFTPSLRLEAYYNQNALYYLGANMRF
jgi:hypothetical protein